MAVHAVTGATSFTGRFIGERLVRGGDRVRDLTRRPEVPHRLGPAASSTLLDFDHPARLAAALEGVDTLYNTFWIRFERGPITYAWAVARCRLLFSAAVQAGVRRIVHISVINASHAAPTAYFRAKATVEDALGGLGISHAIVRPTVAFGPGDILLNNMAWTLRRLPVFGIPGDGRYPIQPVHVDDIAAIAIQAGSLTVPMTVDAAGPNTFTFGEFVALVRQAIGSRTLVVPIPVAAALLAAQGIGLAVRDAVLRRDEVIELQAGLMRSSAEPLGTVRLADWLGANADGLGRSWSNELDRHFRRPQRGG